MASAEMMKKTIVITGATRGLGLAMAEFFEQHRHLVIGCGRNSSHIESLNKRTEQGTGLRRFSVVDISNDKSVGEWAIFVIKEFGPIDILINNAGVINKTANLWEIEPEEFSNVIDVNIKGSFHCIRHFVPQMIKAKKGVIVNFSSTWGKSVSSEVAPYCCTKWGIEGLSKSLALELPPPLACVPLNPGIINTDMLQTTFGEEAFSHHSPKQWVQTAGPLILGISRDVNGKSLNAQ